MEQSFRAIGLKINHMGQHRFQERNEMHSLKEEIAPELALVFSLESSLVYFLAQAIFHKISSALSGCFLSFNTGESYDSNINLFITPVIR